MKPRIRVPMGRERLDSNGLKLYDPARVRFPWMFTEAYWLRRGYPAYIVAMIMERLA